MAQPKRNTAHVFTMVVQDTADPTKFKVNPTIAAGDFRVSTDGGALGNLATLPVVEPAGSRLVKVSLSAAEMDGSRVDVVAVDAAGNEWQETVVHIQTEERLAELPQAAPSATPFQGDAVMLMYMALRNALAVSGTEKRISNDAGTVITKKALADDGTTYTEAEMVSGP